MEGPKKTAIVLGATGLSGGKLVDLLLEDDRYATIKLISRSSLGIDHPKILEYLGDLMQLDSFLSEFTGDEVFCCIGTTKAKTPNKEVYKNIDYGIPVSAAQLSQKNNIKTFMAISALGANSRSNIFYNRIKGEMEEAVLALGLPRTYILQPSLIGGKRKEKRIGEWIFKQLMRFTDLILVGPLEKYRTITPDAIAKAMIWLANHDYEKARIKSDEIKKLG